MNGDMPHDGGHGGGGHATGDELNKTGKYEIVERKQIFLNICFYTRIRVPVDP